MPAFLTPELAEAVIGLCVVAKQEEGGAGSSGWVNPSRVLRVHSYGKVVIQPNNHKKEEVAEVTRLRLWMKGNHQLGEHAMKRAEAIDSIAELQAQVRAASIRDVTVEDAQTWLGNGENPLVLCRVGKRDKAAALGRLIGMRNGNFLVRLAGTQTVLDYEPGNCGVPIGVELDQLDYNLLEKAFVRSMTPQPTPAPKVEPPKPEAPKLPAPGTIPFPYRAPLNAEPPRAPKPEGQGEWVIVDRKSRTFWQRAAGNAGGTGDWVKDIDKASVYDSSKGVNGAASRMKQEGADPEPMSLEQARFFADMWYKPSRLAEVAAEAAAAEMAAVKPEAVDKTPAREESAYPSDDGAQTSRRDALAQAIRNRAAAEVMLLEAKSKEALARADWEIERLGEA